MKTYKEITVEDIEEFWPLCAVDYLADLLNGTDNIETAREDLLSLINQERII